MVGTAHPTINREGGGWFVDDAHVRLRRLVYAVLIAIAAAQMLARVARLRPADPKSPTPFLSANDRSRWATIRALGDHGTYVLDRIIFDSQGNRVRGWHTIDLVKHRGPDGKKHYYSSKPTLLTTLLAGQYWLIKQATGATLADQPEYVARLMLVLTNVLPLVLALVLMAWLVEQFGQSDWSRVLVVAAACFATFLTTFATTLNNHLIAAISLVVGLAVSVPVLRDGERTAWRFAAAGLCFAFLAANELPALSLLVLASLAFLWQSPRLTLVGFLPAVAVVAAGAIGTNYLAHGDWRTPYAHRSNGPVIATIPARSETQLNAGGVPPDLVSRLREANVEISDLARTEQRERGKQWRVWDPATTQELALAKSGDAPDAEIEIRRFDNWYDYEGSYWLPANVRGIDRGEPSPWIYAFNVLVGHHGIFSLTPIWLLSLAGCWLWITGEPHAHSGGEMPAAAVRDLHRTADRLIRVKRLFGLTTVVISVVVVGFYLTRPQIDRNYGGGTCCLRWVIWLTPLWLLALLPAADWLARRGWGIALCLVLLAASVFSAAYGNDNPWSHPWIYDYWTSLGWIRPS
jgi:predicted secreted protein